MRAAREAKRAAMRSVQTAKQSKKTAQATAKGIKAMAEAAAHAVKAAFAALMAGGGTVFVILILIVGIHRATRMVCLFRVLVCRPGRTHSKRCGAKIFCLYGREELVSKPRKMAGGR